MGMTCECDINILKDAKLVSRAHWVCPKCGKDISLEFILLYECEQESIALAEQKKKEREEKKKAKLLAKGKQNVGSKI